MLNTRKELEILCGIYIRMRPGGKGKLELLWAIEIENRKLVAYEALQSMHNQLPEGLVKISKDINTHKYYRQWLFCCLANKSALKLVTTHLSTKDLAFSTDMKNNLR